MARRVEATERAHSVGPDPDEISRSAAAERERIVVLQSAGPPHARRNPYVTQLLAALPGSVQPLYFSWRTALLGRYDVLHVHFPDAAIRGRTKLRSAARTAGWCAVLLRVRFGRRALVRTLHDMQPYDRLPRAQRAVLRLFDRWTTLWITLSGRTKPPSAAPARVIPHGHYRDWYPRDPHAARVPGRLLHFGLIRRYKGTEALLSTFAALPDDTLTLRIVGHPQDGEVLESIHRACTHDRRVSARLEYVPDADLAREVEQSQLVVLPFDRITNSGSLMLALSLDRPVLVPTTPLTEELAAEIGSDWVLTYEPPLGADGLARALEATEHRTGRPDLVRRDWPAIGAQHAAAFTEARELARRRNRWWHRRPVDAAPAE